MAMQKYNEIFSPVRFSNYLKKFSYDNRNTIILSYLLLFLIPIAFCTLIPFLNFTYRLPVTEFNPEDPMWSIELRFFIFFTFGVAIGGGASVYSLLRKKTSRINLFTCPASNFEKFISYFLVYIILLSVIAIAGFFIGDILRVWIYGGNPANTIEPIRVPALYIFTIRDGYYAMAANLSVSEAHILAQYGLTNAAVLFGSLMLIQSLYALGSTIWIKNPHLKTTVIGFIIIIAGSYLFYLGTKIFFSGSIIPAQWLLNDFNDFATPVFSISIVLSLYTWIISYVRFKEWEVIKRW